MTRKLVLSGALSFFVGIAVLVVSFIISITPIISNVLHVVGAVFILVSFVLIGWHICGGNSRNKAPKKVLKSKNRHKRPKEISRSNYGRDNHGGHYDGGVTVIQPSGGSVQSGHNYQPQQQYQYNQQQQQPQQQYYPQYNSSSSGHGYVVSADGYVQNANHGYSGNGVQISGYQHGVQYNPGGRQHGHSGHTQGLGVGALNAGYHGSMDSLNSNTLSYDSDLSAGSLTAGPLRSSMRRPANKDTSSMSSNTSKKSTRFAIGGEQTAV